MRALDRAALLRRRLLAPLLADRVVCELALHVADRLLPSEAALADAGIAVQLAPIGADVALAWLPRVMARLPEEGVAVITTHAALSGDALRRLAPYHAHYTQRCLNGALFQPAAFEGGRIAVLRDAADLQDSVHIYLFGRQELPPLEAGILETTHAPRPEEDGAGTPPAIVLAPPSPIEGFPSGSEGSGQAASLAFRLLEQEQRLLEGFGALRRLQAAGQQNDGGRKAGWFPPSAGQHEWKLARQEQPAAASVNPYDRRVDDAVIVEARAGEAFFATYALDTGLDDAGRAVADLSRRVCALAPAMHAPPDVSIILPVYGQLAYTLNCLDSLFAHASRFSAEIIVVDDCSPDDSAAYLQRLPQIRLHRQPRNGGFIASCNMGASLARGTYVLMLNNDTRVVAGWLDALVDSFGHFPRAGLVGSKMLYADGSLQEAGGIIWRDGSSWNYGRNDDPNRPHYAYAREVDYISGCSVMLRRTDWDALGGFDKHFSPAYCEDADLCLRVVQSGAEVWYQPMSRVVHYEGKTSGTDTGSGVKAYQVQNTKKLFLRWREKLTAHRPNGEEPYFEKDRRACKRMLVIDASAPTPDQDAGSLQTVLGLQSCRVLGYATSFVPEDNFLFQPGYISDLQERGIECIYAPYELGIDSYLRRYGSLFDVILVYRMTVLHKILPSIRRHAPKAVLLFHVADLHFLRTERQAEIEADEGLLARAVTLREQELALVREADCTITHSQFEADLLGDLVADATVQVWPLMYPKRGTTRGFADRRDLIFLGGYRHAPNVDAVQFFCLDILPMLRAAEPGLRFIAAGANPTREVSALAGPQVEVTGMIGDLGPVLDAARVFVCPLRVGAGIKGKIMTALAHGIPVVTTSVGVEGSGLEAGRHVLVADDARSFAEATLRLYRDPELWHRLSLAGLAVMDSFSPASGGAFLGSAIEAAWARKLGVRAA